MSDSADVFFCVFPQKLAQLCSMSASAGGELCEGSESVLRRYATCGHSLQCYDAGIDSHKIRFASNIFTSIPCDWGEVAPGIRKEKYFQNTTYKKQMYTHTHTHPITVVIAEESNAVMRPSDPPDGHWKISRSTGL